MKIQDLLSYNLIKHHGGHKEQLEQTRIMKATQNYAQRIVLQKLQLSLCKPPKTPFKTVYVFAEKSLVFWISALQMSGKNRNRFESLLSVWTNPVYKTSWASFPAKQAATVGFSLGFNVKLLHDWSNFDLPRLMPVEHIFLMPLLCLSLTPIHARIHANKLLITAQPIRNLRTPASAEMNKRGFL